MITLPVLHKMQELYQTPRDRSRFNRYLHLLQGSNKEDILLPIAGFNPMADESMLNQVNTLIKLRAEELIGEAIEELTQENKHLRDMTLQVALNIGDDLGGAWTKRYVTDYESKFNISALHKRNMCVVYLWSSEVFTLELIFKRIKSYILRYAYQDRFHRPSTLAEHIAQEHFIYDSLLGAEPTIMVDQRSFLTTYAASTSYVHIFNFLYGDKACVDMGYQTFGITSSYPFYDL